ncbi:transcriptional regulator [Ligilactobacillus agilis]|uniref:transcriptional regulator n=1 Tax=Ligilactobacillus agilis TaxID=1601 RepID=UPI001F59F959|nr:transcriptional regulator [Ligilactobacillus agilis]
MTSEQITLDMPRVDYDKTAESVLEFLTNKDCYPKLKRICLTADPKNLQSPSLSGMSSGSFGNSADRKMSRYLAAKVIVDAVAATISKGSIEMKIVCDDVLGKIPSVRAMEQLHFEKSRYYEVKKRALNEFADIFEVQGYYCPDLHVYID